VKIEVESILVEVEVSEVEQLAGYIVVPVVPVAEERDRECLIGDKDTVECSNGRVILELVFPLLAKCAEEDPGGEGGEETERRRVGILIDEGALIGTDLDVEGAGFTGRNRGGS
jgi:hypothetical protein